MTRRTYLMILKGLLGGGALLFLSWPVLSFLSWRQQRTRQVIFSAREQEDGVRIKDGVILVVEQGVPLALSAKCTHLGCIVGYRASRKAFVCPCHRSEYDRKGVRLQGPAQQDLPELPVDTGDQGEWIVSVETG